MNWYLYIHLFKFILFIHSVLFLKILCLMIGPSDVLVIYVWIYLMEK